MRLYSQRVSAQFYSVDPLVRSWLSEVQLRDGSRNHLHPQHQAAPLRTPRFGHQQLLSVLGASGVQEETA